jgi:hypothetical protein
MALFITYDLITGGYTIGEVPRYVFPNEDVIVADISHWTKEDFVDFENKHTGDQIGQLEGIELIDGIKAELTRRPL